MGHALPREMNYKGREGKEGCERQKAKKTELQKTSYVRKPQESTPELISCLAWNTFQRLLLLRVIKNADNSDKFYII